MEFAPQLISLLFLVHMLTSPFSCGAPVESYEALLLTPFLNRGDVQGGQKAARNSDFFGPKESYSGYFTVSQTTRSHLFFWFFRAEINPGDAPVVLWLQGGPGASSLSGTFLEHGPYEFVANSTLAPRQYYWSQRFHVLYLDNPVGSGFSFTEAGDYSTNECQVGANLYEAVTQFFRLFPELRTNKFYIAGESYAGKYVPSLAHYIHKNNPNATNRINMSGIVLGNSLIDPSFQVDNSELLYQLGLLDEDGLHRYRKIVLKTLSFIQKKSWNESTDEYFRLFDFVHDATGMKLLFNFLKDYDDLTLNELETFLNEDDARKALHVGMNKFCIHDDTAYEMLDADRMKSVKSWFVEILDNYDVLIYHGQLDLVKPYSGMVRLMNHLLWSGSSGYKTAPRSIWRVKGRVAGYSKTVWHLSSSSKKPIKFVETLVRNAGHLVPRDQPLWALDMMLTFTGGGGKPSMGYHEEFRYKMVR